MRGHTRSASCITGCTVTVAHSSFVDFYPAVGCGLWWRDVHVHSSTELPDARIGGLLFHDQIPHCFESFARDAGGTAPASFKAKHYAYSSAR
jgi:hypothetical protein